MAVTFIRDADLNDYYNISGSDDYDPADESPQTHFGFTDIRIALYYERLDFWLNKMQSAVTVGRFDPLLVSTGGNFTISSYSSLTTQPSSNSVDSFCVGYFDGGENEQRLYGFDGNAASSERLVEVNPIDTTQVISTDPYPNFSTEQSEGTIITSADTLTDGFYSTRTGGLVVFETAGYAIMMATTVRVDGSNLSGCTVQVDLTTGEATPLEIPSTYGINTHEFDGGDLFGDTYTFRSIQFSPDDASTAASPVGLLFMYSDIEEVSGGPASRMFFKLVEWNPNNVDSTPSRVHLRERLLTAWDTTNNDGATDGTIFENAGSMPLFSFYHPNTNQVYVYSGGGLTTPAGVAKLISISTSPAISTFTQPYALENVETGKTVSFGVDALGSLNEKITGADFDFTLQRVSTVDEEILATDHSESAGASVSVANPFFPDTDTTANPVVVKQDGTELTETTHYTVDFANDEIDFVSPHPEAGSAYTVTYRHWETPVTPATGATLRNATATTDTDGVAIARVQFDEEDPVDDRWYRVDATQS